METIYNWRDRKILSKVPIPKRKETIYILSLSPMKEQRKRNL